MKAMKFYRSSSHVWMAILLFLFSVAISSCSEDDANPIEKKITGFVFLLTENPINVNVIAQINESAKTITAIMPEGTDVNGLIPDIEVSSGATVTPTIAQDFTNPVTYTVTGQDGSTATYTATVTAALSQRNILQIILDENPGNTLGWIIPNSGDLGVLDGVTTNINGNIIELAMRVENLSRLPAEVGQLTSLRILIVSDNLITTLPSEIGQLTSLEELDLLRNDIASLPESIGNLSNLVSLNATSNSLTSIPEEIGQLSNLTTLNLGGNQISSLPSVLFQMTGLLTLSLNMNQLISIPKEIGHLTNLRVLILNENPLSALPPEIGFLTDLEGLHLSETNISLLPLSVCLLEDFNNLDIFGVGFTCSNTPTEIDALISIYAANPNNTLGWGVDNYPGVTFLTDGSIRDITANDKNLARLPTSIGQLSSLEVLTVSDNSFGSIPSSIGDINTLAILTLHTTNINTVPSSLGQLNNLVFLQLKGNPITSIPQEVCDLQISNGGILEILTDPGEGCD